MSGGYGSIDSTSGVSTREDGRAMKAIQSTLALTKNKRTENPTSSLDVYVTIIKANVGTGVLALPQAFNKAGYGVGGVFLITITIITVHCMLLLVASGQTLTKKLGIQALEYGQVTQMAFLNLKRERVNLGCCKVKTSILGTLSKIVVNIFLALTQFGLSTAYWVFVAGTLQYLVAHVPYIEYDIDIRLWILILLVPFVLITYIRDLRTLSPFVTVANLCLLFVVIVIIFDAISRFVTQRAAVNCQQQNSTLDPNDAMICGVSPWPLHVTDLFIFFGVAVFSFEGIGFVMPLENKMAKPKQFKPILIAGMSTVATVYFVIGMIGYLAYGKCSQSNLTLDLNSDVIWLSSLYHIAQLYIAFTIFLSHALQFYVPMDFIEPPILLKLKLLDTENNKRKKVLRYLVQVAIRTSFVIIMCGVALIDPKSLGDYISLVGACAGSSLAFIFPPLLHILVFAGGDTYHTDIGCEFERSVDMNRNDDDNRDIFFRRTTPWQCVYKMLWIGKDVAIFLFGIVGAVFGTYSTIADMVSHFDESSLLKECSGA